MNMDRSKKWFSLLLVAGGLSVTTAMSTGCQTTIGGQTLPSGSNLTDDVQYFPAGPEAQLPNARRAHQEYRENQ